MCRLIARYCYRMSSVHPSLPPSVTLKYRGRISWVCSKVIARIISLGSSLLGAQQRQSSSMETPQNSGEIGGIAVLSRQSAISETGQDRTKVTIDD